MIYIGRDIGRKAEERWNYGNIVLKVGQAKETEVGIQIPAIILKARERVVKYRPTWNFTSCTFSYEYKPLTPEEIEE